MCSGGYVPCVWASTVVVIVNTLTHQCLRTHHNNTILTTKLRKHSIGLPDVHSGYGFAIGNMAAFDMDNPESIVSPGMTTQVFTSTWLSSLHHLRNQMLVPQLHPPPAHLHCTSYMDRWCGV